MIPAKTLYSAQSQKFITRIWNELITTLTFFVIIIGAVIICTKSIGIGLGVLFLLSVAIVLNYINQYKYRFVQAISISEEEDTFVFELLYKDELYEQVVRKRDISTKLETENGRGRYITKLCIFDREKEVFVLYADSHKMKQADLKKLKAELDS